MEDSCSVVSGSAKPCTFSAKLGVELIPSCEVRVFKNELCLSRSVPGFA